MANNLHPAFRRTSMWRDTLHIAFDAVEGNRSRALLTVLSVIIGVASVVFSVSAGDSLSGFIETQLSSLGNDLMWLSPAREETDATRRAEPLTYDDAVALGNLPSVRQIGPRAAQTAVVSLDQRHMSAELLAVGADYFPMRNKHLALGRPLLASDLSLRRRSCVVGPGVVERLLYQTPDPLGRVLKIDGKPFVVVGVLARSEGNLKTPGLEEDDAVFVPLTTAARLFGMEALDFVFFQPSATVSRDVVRQEIRQLFLLRKGPRAAVEIDSLDERMAQIENLIGVAVLVFGAIAGVALIVAGIGIMNIMLLSVMERTREIGIRKAVGARNHHILVQFFTESVLLSGFGGVLGILLGGGATLLLALVTSGAIWVSWRAAVIAFLFALAVGVFFGLYPAVRASQLSPITALSREVG